MSQVQNAPHLAPFQTLLCHCDLAVLKIKCCTYANTRALEISAEPAHKPQSFVASVALFFLYSSGGNNQVTFSAPKGV